MATAQQRLNTAGVTITDDAAVQLEQLIRRGATTAVRDHLNNEQLGQASRALNAFVARLIEEASKSPQATVRIGDPQFKAAQASVCPLYPFC